MTRDWNDFKEKIDHEMPRCSPINKYAHRVDEKKGFKEGIRNFSNISQSLSGSCVKSCDYFMIDDNKEFFYCLEFSDLLSQKHSYPEISFNRLASSIKSYHGLINTPRNVIKKIYKITNPDYIIKNELIDKIRDTDLLIKHIYAPGFTRITNLPNSSLKKFFFIIYIDYIDDSKSIDCIKLFDDMLSDMKISSLNKILCPLNNSVINSENIFFLNLEEFRSRYC